MTHGDGPLGVLTLKAMYEADAAAAAAGVAGSALMENAGRAVADAVAARWTPRPVAVLCGPGNNGGDGFVAARLLAERGWPVRVACLVERDALTGDARHHADLWRGPVAPLDGFDPAETEIVVDALFGAGLTRPLEGAAARGLAAIGARPVVAVDVPSGVQGDTGQALGPVAPARATVTFFRLKPAHLLYPGRALCGDIVLSDIGIPDSVLPAGPPDIARNAPALWRDAFPWARWDRHKFARGHVLVLGGPRLTGAARLAARGAQRCGAGYVTLAAPDEAKTVYRVALESIVVQPFRDTAGFRDLAVSERVSAAVLGPGIGLTPATREKVTACLAARKPSVLDADALSVFEGAGELLASHVHADTVLTPHEGEFRRLFPDLTHPSKLVRARSAAARLGAVVLFKGPDTVIAHPDGTAWINTHAGPDLATAGAGDVLAGMIGGLMAGGMSAFKAAAAAAWLHGDASLRFGPGLIPEDILATLPRCLAGLARVDEAGDAPPAIAPPIQGD